MNEVWKDLHKSYKKQDWINKPSIFATQAIKYFPKYGKILELGCGQAQDGCYFAEHGYSVICTDIEDSALELAKNKVEEKALDVVIQKIDIRDEMPFDTESFDVVYAHLSLHYFDKDISSRLFEEIQRILKPGGILAFLVNSVNDPEYQQGEQIESDFYQIGKAQKRFFSESTTRVFMKYFEICLVDEFGETYKDQAKGVHNLVRFIGRKPKEKKLFDMAIPFVGAIVERERNGIKEFLLSTRWKTNADPLYHGTLEFPAGVLDKPFENIFDAIAREIKEEVGLTVKKFKGEDKIEIKYPISDCEIIGFKPFCCTQHLKGGKPWIGFIFVVEVDDSEPKAQLTETKDPSWFQIDVLQKMIHETPESFLD